jgi:hypothetical protein
VGSKLLPLGITLEYAGPEAVRTEIRDEHRMVEELARKAGLVR